MNADDAEKLKALLSGSDAGIDEAWIEEMKVKYPFFPIPECVALREKSADMSADEREDAAARLALSLSSTEALERIVEPDGDRFDELVPAPDVPATPSTDRAIDKFLATYGGADAAETEILERMIFNPVADYSQQLARQEETALPDALPTGDSRTDRINRFILSVRGNEDSPAKAQAVCKKEEPPIRKDASAAVITPASGTPAAKSPAVPSDNSLLSESLAKIYIKTRRYERAYEILNRLSLAFPEKNAYFADQLRFLRKLMLAESCRKQRDSKTVHPE